MNKELAAEIIAAINNFNTHSPVAITSAILQPQNCILFDNDGILTDKLLYSVGLSDYVETENLYEYFMGLTTKEEVLEEINDWLKKVDPTL